MSLQFPLSNCLPLYRGIVLQIRIPLFASRWYGANFEPACSSFSE